MPPSGWIRTTIGDQVLLQRGIDITKAEQRNGRVPVISSGGTSSYHDTAAATGPGVVLGRKGVVGSVFYSKEDYWPHDTTLWVKDFKGNHPRFVYYYFLGKARQIATMDVGSANPTLNRNHVHPIETDWPRDKSEQEGIAATLGALDDKIEHNRRTSRALEVLARAILKAWFVDFEPVHAKVAGATSFPGMPPEAFAALPTRFTDSELGRVPDGWIVASLPQLAVFLNGLALQKYPPRADGSDLPVIKIAELRKGSTDGADAANSNVPPQYIISDGDLLFSWSGTLEVRRWFGGKGALNQHLFKVTPARLPLWFIHHAVLTHLPEFRAIASSKATTMGHIQRKHLEAALVAAPPEEVLRSAHAIIAPLYDLTATLEVESRKLALMRDYLLSKLLSGEVRVTGPGSVDGA